MQTRTGNFPLGLRRGGAKWQQDLRTLIEWAKTNNLEVIDLGKDGATAAKTVLDAGLRVGSVDLLHWKEMIVADQGSRAEAIARNSDYIRACAVYGPMNHFLVMLPQDPSLDRAQNFGYMVESFNQLASVLEANNARLVIEGWPGPGALCCTPEGYRAFFRECSSVVFGINYDPSHLIRMGIDYLRFLHEFGSRVYHLHGKDTDILAEELYEYGHEQPATFATPIAYGGHSWRYTIPGQGLTRWGKVLNILQEQGYAGFVSIELEDANFDRQVAAEQLGILQGARFLCGC